jgi:hypothetical protein
MPRRFLPPDLQVLGAGDRSRGFLPLRLFYKGGHGFKPSLLPPLNLGVDTNVSLSRYYNLGFGHTRRNASKNDGSFPEEHTWMLAVISLACLSESVHIVIGLGQRDRQRCFYLWH